MVKYAPIYYHTTFLQYWNETEPTEKKRGKSFEAKRQNEILSISFKLGESNSNAIKIN